MVKRSFTMLLFLSLAVVLIFGLSACAKKATVSEKPAVTQPEAKPTEPAKPPVAEKKPEDDAAKRAEQARIAKAQELLKQFTSENVYFDFDKFNIKDSEKPKLERKKQWMADNATAKVLIEGHCDERGTNEYNLALGDRRANSCKQYLVLLGVDGKRLSTISYGEEKPVDPGHNEQAWAKNRRAQFVVTAQ